MPSGSVATVSLLLLEDEKPVAGGHGLLPRQIVSVALCDLCEGRHGAQAERLVQAAKASVKLQCPLKSAGIASTPAGDIGLTALSPSLAKVPSSCRKAP